MNHTKCSKCQRKNECTLRELAVLTLPWVKKAIHASDTLSTNWDMRHNIHRALRGIGGAPGFVEDWLFAGAMTQEDVSLMIETILRYGDVEFSVLVRPCRHYVGPIIRESAEWNHACL